MDALEEFEIYKSYNSTNNHDGILNDKLNFKSNPLYDTALHSLEINNLAITRSPRIQYPTERLSLIHI